MLPALIAIPEVLHCLSLTLQDQIPTTIPRLSVLGSIYLP